MEKIKFAIPIVLAVFAVAGGFWGMLSAEDRWNQSSAVDKNKIEIQRVENEMTAGVQQLLENNEITFYEQQLEFLYNQLTQAKLDRRANPDDPDIKERIEEIKERISKTKEKLEGLLEKKKEG